MRLLNTEMVELHEFFDRSIPRYDILSHRWEAGEVSFQDVIYKRNLDAPGWIKVRNFCQFLWNRKYKWAWIDTCCIDKTNNVELSEAINSMYKWYTKAENCFVYFCDVDCDTQDMFQYSTAISPGNRGDMRCMESTAFALRDSRWFTRGWTLQELVAPQEAIFLDRQWRIFGSRSTLSGLVSSISGIENIASLIEHRPSVATRMSWASNRDCTRSEDVAYSLMGLFSVNMPLLYGEGEYNAYRRLQLEILKNSADESIFAWSVAVEPLLQTGSMLADSRRWFSQSSKIHPFEPTVRRLPYTMTNKGLEITTVILSSQTQPNQHYLPLNCYEEKTLSPLAIPLARTEDHVYSRVGKVQQLPEENDLEIEGSKLPSLIYILEDNSDGYPRSESQLEAIVRRKLDRYLSL